MRLALLAMNSLAQYGEQDLNINGTFLTPNKLPGLISVSPSPTRGP